jgi:integrase
VLGLKWKDIGPKQIQIRRGLVCGRLTTTKSGKERTVPISSDLRTELDELAEQRHVDEGAWSDPEFVFVSPHGKRWDERNFARSFDRLRRKAHKLEKVRNLSFHCARHTFASWALEGGRSIVWVQNRLGHGSPGTTLSIYSHFLPGTENELDFLTPALKIVSVTKT